MRHNTYFNSASFRVRSRCSSNLPCSCAPEGRHAQGPRSARRRVHAAVPTLLSLSILSSRLVVHGTLASLTLSSNVTVKKIALVGIDAESGFVEFGEALRMNPLNILTDINFSRNKIGDRGIAGLANGFVALTHTLSRLILRECGTLFAFSVASEVLLSSKLKIVFWERQIPAAPSTLFTYTLICTLHFSRAPPSPAQCGSTFHR